MTEPKTTPEELEPETEDAEPVETEDAEPIDTPETPEEAPRRAPEDDDGGT